MSGRIVATVISTEDQPELPKNAQLQLEADRLFFTDVSGKVSYIRPAVEGEALPYVLHKSAMVVVKKHQREFVVLGKQTLIIRHVVETPERKKIHQTFNVSDIQRQRAEARRAEEAEKSLVVQITDKEKDLRRQQEKIRRAAQVQVKNDRRNGITAVKRAEKLCHLAERRAANASLPTLELVGPAIVPSPNAA